jgi:hypothetical protein
MASNSTFSRLSRLLEYMPAEQLLDEVFQGLSDTEAHGILEHIEDMWDLAEDDEEEDDDIDDADAEDELLYDEDDDVEEEVPDETGNVINKVLAFRRKE